VHRRSKKKHHSNFTAGCAAAKSQSGEAVIVDVREKDERDEEQIPNAPHLSRGTIELDIEAAGLPMTK
jgi:rhodanese-related sulfurtransferase